MDPEQVYEHLENLAERLGISIRYDDLCDSEEGAKSGLCNVKGGRFYIMDTSKSLAEKIRLLSQCLSRMDLEGVYVLPMVRELLQSSARVTNEQ